MAFRDFSPDLSSPKGAAYHDGLNRVLVSISPTPGGRVQILKTVRPDGRSEIFAPGYRPYRDVEAFIAVVPQAGPPVAAGFTPGDVFVGRGPNGQISRIRADGTVLADVWVDLQSTGLWGGMAFDGTGTFGGRLVAMDRFSGKVFLVTAGGTAVLLKDVGQVAEGLAVAPTGFGPLAGQIILAIEGSSDEDPRSGEIYALDSNATLTLLADIGYAAEDLQFVPANGGTYYQCELNFERVSPAPNSPYRERENRLLAASSSQFLSRLGHLLIANEMTGDLFEVAWDGSQYRLMRAGRVPGRWSSEGFLVQGTELEAGCFAARPARVPAWSAWSPVAGGGTTDRAPAAVADFQGNLHLLVKGIGDRRVYMNNMWGSGPALRTWTGWAEIPPGGLTTSHGQAAALHNRSVYVFAVRDDGVIVSKRLFGEAGPASADPWAPVPGDFRTNAAVAAVVCNGRLVICVKGLDDQLYLNELQPGGRGLWSGWSVVPGGGSTDAAPGLAVFQDDLYLLVKGLTTNRILAKVRLLEGEWTDYVELPGAGRSDAPAAAVATGGQLHVFVKGVGPDPFINVASDTGTWSGWSSIADGLATDTALAATAIASQIYLFGRRTSDGQLTMRFTQ